MKWNYNRHTQNKPHKMNDGEWGVAIQLTTEDRPPKRGDDVEVMPSSGRSFWKRITSVSEPIKIRGRKVKYLCGTEYLEK